MIKNKGFSLIELAIVLVIIGVIISAIMAVVPTLIQKMQYEKNQTDLSNAYNAIVTYAQTNGTLPYAGNSTATNGLIPSQFSAIGKDAYGNTLYYAANSYLTHNNIPMTQNNATLTNNQELCIAINIANQMPVSQQNIASETTSNACSPSTPYGCIKDAFIVISKGQNGKLDFPNSSGNSTGIFAYNQFTPSNSYYDDSIKSLTLNNAQQILCPPNSVNSYSCTISQGSNYTCTPSISSNPNVTVNTSTTPWTITASTSSGGIGGNGTSSGSPQKQAAYEWCSSYSFVSVSGCENCLLSTPGCITGNGQVNQGNFRCLACIWS